MRQRSKWEGSIMASLLLIYYGFQETESHNRLVFGDPIKIITFIWLWNVDLRGRMRNFCEEKTAIDGHYSYKSLK